MDPMTLIISYLVWGDDGKDGKLLLIAAPNAETIVKIFPLFIIFDKRPPWVTEDVYNDLQAEIILFENITSHSLFFELNNYLTLINSKGRKSFLIANDYGQGARWLKVCAETPEDIINKFPHFNVFTRCPPWFPSSVFEDLEKNVNMVDIEDLNDTKF